MTDCGNETIRDLLPLLAHDALEADEATRVRAHVASCASCATELELLGAARRVFDGATPQMNAAAIVAGLPVPTPTIGGRPVLRLERAAGRRRFSLPSYALAAAASLILVATLSVGALRSVFFGASGSDSTEVAAVETGSGAATETAEILGAGGLSELGTAELTALLAELEAMEATVAAEPNTIRPPTTATPEGI